MADNLTELCTKTISDVAPLIRKREVSPVELTQAMLDRIAAHDGRLHSYLTVSSDVALRQAEIAEKEMADGRYRGLLHGVPIAVKDLIYTKEIRTTCGSKVLAQWTPEFDATVIERLHTAGAVLLGKLTMTEFAGLGYHESIEPPVNPWNPHHWTGQSSSGSGVAVAASLCFGSIGSDTGGSIRFPAAACGVVGLKPTYGLVSRHGVHPLADSLDHAGPIARCVADAAVLLESIAGFDVRDLTTQRGLAPNYLETLTDGLKGFRLGIDEGFCTDGVDAEVGQAVLAASRVFGRLGATIRPVKISLVEEAIGAWAVIFTAECVSAHEKMFAAHADDYTPAFRQFQKDGARVRGVDYARAYATRQSVHRMLEDLFQDIDLFLCPTMGLLPPSLDVFPPNGLIPMELTGALLKFTAPFSLTGNPALSVPCGLSRNGLPIALEIVGRPRDEQTVLRAGYAYEQATEWHRRRPSV